MPSYGYNAIQTVALNQGAIVNTISGCPCGKILHEDETPTILLRGIPKTFGAAFAKYKVTAIANIALPEGVTIVPIAVAFSVDGDVRITTRAISSPTVVDTYDNVTVSDIIRVPRGCCSRIRFGNVSASEAADYVPAQNINVQNLNITIDQVQ